MQQTEKKSKVGIQLLFHHFLEVELKIAQPYQAGCIPQQAKVTAVRNESIGVLSIVQVLLNQCMRPETRTARFPAPVEIVVQSHDVNGKAVKVCRHMAYGIALPGIWLDESLSFFNVVAQNTKQRDHP